MSERSNNDPCVHCGESTAFGSGRFVNRIGWDDGWACAECAGSECSECGKQIPLDEEVRVHEVPFDEMTGFHDYHSDCYDAKKHGPATYGGES